MEVIVDVIKRANVELRISCKLVLNVMDLELYGWRGDEPFLLVVNPPYPMEWFTEQNPLEAGLLDIHAGAFETAVLNYLCPELVDLQTAGKLKSTSLNAEGLQKWLQGGEAMKKTLPLGYAGNPADYPAASRHVEEMLVLQMEEIAKQIMHLTALEF